MWNMFIDNTGFKLCEKVTMILCVVLSQLKMCVVLKLLFLIVLFRVLRVLKIAPKQLNRTVKFSLWSFLCAVCSGADWHQCGHQAADTAGSGLPHTWRRCRGARKIQGQTSQLCTTCKSFFPLCRFSRWVRWEQVLFLLYTQDSLQNDKGILESGVLLNSTMWFSFWPKRHCQLSSLKFKGWCHKIRFGDKGIIVTLWAGTAWFSLLFL